MPGRKININQKYGKLLVLEQVLSKPGAYRYKVQCDCGNITDTFLSQKMQRNQLHCGCETKTHDLHGTKIYKLWTRLKHFHKLCDAWQDINQFVKDVGIEVKGFMKPIKNGLLGPDNFKWVSTLTDTNGLITINNISHNALGWSKICGVSRQALQQKKEYHQSSYEEIILTYPKALEHIEKASHAS